MHTVNRSAAALCNLIVVRVKTCTNTILLRPPFVFLPRDAMHKRGLRCRSVSVCPSVWCLLHSCILLKWVNKPWDFLPSGSRTILVFLYQTLWQYSDARSSLTETSNPGGIWKIAIFDQYLALSQKWYKTELYLQLQTNSKSYNLSNGAIFNDPDYKVTPLSDAEYLRNDTR